MFKISLTYIFSALLIFWTCECFAQNLTSKDLIKYSTEISNVQLSTYGKTYDKDKQTYTISFPKENFNVFLSTGLAYHAVYKAGEQKEVLQVTEGIDLLKMIKLQPGINTGNSVDVLQAVFPPGYLKTKLIVDGNEVYTISENYIEFFYPKGDVKSKQQLMADLLALKNLKKQAKENPDAKTKTTTATREKPIKVIRQPEDSLQRRDRLYNTFLSTGNAHLAKKEFKEAQEAYWNAIALKPDADDPQNKLLQIEKEVATTTTEKVYDSIINEATAQFKDKLYDAAEISFLEALKLNPESAIARDQVKYIRQIKAEIARIAEKNRLEDLEAAFKNAVKKGNMAIAEKRYGDAYTAYKVALHIHPDDEWCLSRYKIAEYQMGLQKN